MPIFRPGDDPGSSFPELLRRLGSGPVAASGDHDLVVPHATTCIALRFADGVFAFGVEIDFINRAAGGETAAL